MPIWYSCFPYVLEGGTCDCEEYDDIQTNKTFIPRWMGVSVIYLDIRFYWQTWSNLKGQNHRRRKDHKGLWGRLTGMEERARHELHWWKQWEVHMKWNHWGSPSCTYFILRMAGFQSTFFLKSPGISVLLLIAFYSLKPPCLCSQLVFLSPILCLIIQVQNTSKIGSKLKWYWHRSA